MDIEQLAKQCGGVSTRVVDRAKELQRLAAVKKGVDAFTAPAACLIVAGRELSEELDQAKVSKLGGVNERMMVQTIRKITDMVGAKTVVGQTTPSALCVRFGCLSICEMVTRVHSEYQVVVRGLGKRNKHQAHDPQDPAFIAACLFACSKQASLRVDKRKLVEAVCGNPKTFDSIVTSIEVRLELCVLLSQASTNDDELLQANCKSTLSMSNVRRNRQGNGRKRGTKAAVDQPMAPLQEDIAVSAQAEHAENSVVIEQPTQTDWRKLVTQLRGRWQQGKLYERRY
ncbi:TPA: hypothetical protein N0F65_003848 [Lagenidium giganteum]|uniref:ORC6 second cyclin-like domain-containing protein n=1 Tax=Lagenidium giganteum TaxID=4803 RepID=A0AAV2YRC2_9STRA|nr:TPA: hypothetical protein N0F65_003848 [Lagenidium giganteum]